MPPVPPLSVSQFTTMKQSFDEDLALYQRLGVTHIELCERKLSDDPAKRSDQLAALKDAGISVTSIQPQVHALFPDRMSPEPAKPEERLARFRQTIDWAAEQFPGVGMPLVAIGGKAPDFDFRKCHAAARRLYPELADHAAEGGLRIAFEMLQPVLMNLDTFICTLDEALLLMEDVGHPNFGLVIDSWNVWQERDLFQRVAALGDRMFLVQLSDWPAGGVRNTDDRLVPGDGIIDLPRLLKAVRSAGYSGAYELEILSAEQLPDSLWRADPADVIGRSRTAFERAWQDGGA